MNTRKIMAISLAACLFVPVAFAEMISINKPSVRGMKDGKMTMISASEVDFPVNAQKVGTFYQFTYKNSEYKLRLSDVSLAGTQTARACLPGEKQVISENASIGGTQMGSGQYECQ